MIYTIISVVFNALIILVILYVVLSYFMSPYHPIRSALDKVVNPILAPIRKIVPPIMNLDFSPVILIIILQVIEWLLLRIV
jgi:YggT family protein